MQQPTPATNPSGVLLGTSQQTGQPVIVGEVERQLGMYVLGLAGMGKSTLLLNMMLQDIKSGHGLCLIDPNRDLVQDVIAHADIPPEKLVLLDAGNWEAPFGLNLFECLEPDNPIARNDTRDYVYGIFQKLWGEHSPNPSWGANIEDILTHITQTFVQVQGYTLVDVPAFLEDEAFRDHVIGQASLGLQDYWHRNYSPRKDQLSYRASTLNKVRKFTDHEVLRFILGQPKSSISIQHIMDEGKILLVSLTEGEIGAEAVTLLGSILIGQILQATLKRVKQERADRRPFALYCDEYYYFATPDFARFFREGRKMGIKTVVAHQWRSQLDKLSRDATLSVTNKVMFKINPDDAQELRRQFTYTAPEPELPIIKEPLMALIEKRHANQTVNDFVDRVKHLVVGYDHERPTKLVPISDMYWHITYILEHAMTDPSWFQSQAVQYQLFFFLERHGQSVGLPKYSYSPPLRENRKRRSAIEARYLPHLGITTEGIDLPDLEPPERKRIRLQKEAAERAEQLAEREKAYQAELERLLLDFLQTVLADKPQNESWEQLQAHQTTYEQPLMNQTLHVFVNSLVDVVRILARSPLRDSRVLGIAPTPTHEADVVGLLTNLDKGHARVRLQQGDVVFETTIQTMPPPVDKPEVIDARRQAVTTRHQFGAKHRDTIAREIRDRQHMKQPPTIAAPEQSPVVHRPMPPLPPRRPRRSA